MSTTFQTTSRTDHGKFTIVVTENSYSISSNTSNVTVELKYTSSGQYYCGVDSFKITDATGVVLGSYSRSYGVVKDISKGTQTLKTFTGLTASHLQDGTGSLTLYIKYSIGNHTDYTDTFVFTSTQIPRGSLISVNLPSLTVTKDGAASVTVTVTPQTTGYYHIVTYESSGSGVTTTLVNKVIIDSSTDYTLTKDNILTAIPRRQIDTLVFTCKTYSDSACTTQIGNDAVTSMTVNLDPDLAPTLTISSIAASTTSGEFSISGYLIGDGKTKAVITYSTSLQTGATIEDIYFTPPTGTGSFSRTTTASGTIKSTVIPLGLNSNVQYVVSYLIRDSRGFTSSGTFDSGKICYAYAKPLINVIAYRVSTNTGDNSKVEDPAGSYVYFRLEGVCTNVDSQNAIKTNTAYTYIQQTGGSAKTINTDNWVSVNLDDSAIFAARIEDQISYSTTTYTVGAASFPLDLYDNSKGNVGGGFGTVATAGQYEFAFPAMGPGTIEFIRGTQTATTNVWTGVSKQKALREGMIISYYLPYAGNSTGATLNLTLADGTTTGAKNCYFNSTSRLTTHFGQYSQFSLVYHENFNINGTNYTGWWVLDKGYDTTNTYNLRKYRGYATYTALYRYQICLEKDPTHILPVNAVSNSVATTKTLTTENFNPFGSIFFYNTTTTYGAGSNVANDNLHMQMLCDIRYAFNIGGNTVASTLDPYKPLYLVCDPLPGCRAQIHTSSPLSQTLPTSMDGLIYIYLGQMYPDTNPYRLNLEVNHPIYYYDGNAIALWHGKYEWITFWTGSLAGNSATTFGVGKSLSQYSRIRVYFKSYRSSGQFDIDLVEPAYQPIDADAPYSGSGAAPYWNSTNSRLETHVCWASVSYDKLSIVNNWQGYSYGTTYVDRNGIAGYYIYRIDAIKDI